MARKVTISSIGQYPPRFPIGEKFPDYNALNENMIAFWQRQINAVLPDKPDVIALPELCDRYWEVADDDSIKLRDAMGDLLLGVLQSVARENNCYIVYAAARPEADGSWRNAAVMIGRDGKTAGQYNKNHTVHGEIESGILCGAGAPIIECDFGRVAFAICFDLNFDELRLQYKKARPDLIIFPSMYHGGLMQAYWAYSCRAHFVGCTGTDVTPNEFYSPVGTRLAASTNYHQNITATLNLDCAVAHLDYNGEKLERLKEKYGRDVTIFDPGQLASVLISSESETVGVQEMIAEFEIELLDDYMVRALAHHHHPDNREAA